MNLNNYIEHTLLRPDTTTAQIKELCQEAIDYNFVAVCVPPFFVKAAAKYLEEHSTKVVTVVGFPMGYQATPIKVDETKRALAEGADEIDMVVNIAAIKDNNWSHVKSDIDSINTTVHLRGKILKVIIETGLLSIPEIKQVCEICSTIKVQYVKTSTGINAGGATIEIVEYLKSHLTDDIKIKASGGIKDQAFAKQLIEAGADRLGTSSGIKIVE